MTVTVKPASQTTLSPLWADASIAPPTMRAAYSDRTASLMASVCEYTYAAPSRRGEVERALAAGGFRLGAVTARSLLVIAPKLTILAFRGTSDFDDWRLDLSARRVPLPGSPGLRVHEGFLSAFESDRAAVTAALRSARRDGVPVYITGHSLGGALAQLAAATFDGDELAACYTFGSPRVGTLAFDELVKTPHYRVVNAWDIVPGVPAPFLRGYRHSGDPRLLLPGEHQALRRDRSPVPRFLADVAASLTAAVTHKLPVVDDHMIWNYRARLEDIAFVRSLDPLKHEA